MDHVRCSLEMREKHALISLSLALISLSLALISLSLALIVSGSRTRREKAVSDGR
jgi:hypothetical protein